MISTILYSVVAAGLLLLLIRELKSFMGLKFYKKQGIQTTYIPFMGYMWLLASFNPLDALQRVKDYFKYSKKKNLDFYVFNVPNRQQCLIFPQSSKFFRDLFTKESECLNKINVLANFNLGFMDKSDPENIRKRLLLRQFFHQDNLSSMVDLIQNTAASFFDDYASTIWDTSSISSQGFKTVNLNEQLDTIFTNVVDLLLFRNKKEEIIKIEGVDLGLHIIRSFENAQIVFFSPENILSLETLFINNLHPKLWKIQKEMDKSADAVFK